MLRREESRRRRRRDGVPGPRWIAIASERRRALRSFLDQYFCLNRAGAIDSKIRESSSTWRGQAIFRRSSG